MYFYIDDLISRIEYFRVKSKNNINKVTECGILLLNQTKNNKCRSFDKMLIIYQNESKKWGLPKGHLDDREFLNKQFMECAKRELYEETGIYLNRTPLLNFVEGFRAWGHKRKITYMKPFPGFDSNRKSNVKL